MPTLSKRLFAGLAVAALFAVSNTVPVTAQEIWFNPFTDPDPYYMPPADEQPVQPPPKRVVPQQPKSMSIIDAAVPMANNLSMMPQMKILGLWVGNVRYRVGSADGRLFLISKDGQLKLLPTKTDADSITIPEDSPVVARLLAEQAAGGNGDSNSNPASKDAPKFSIGQVGLLKPKVIGTRTQMVNGKAVVTAGAIISEWVQPESTTPNVQPVAHVTEQKPVTVQHTMARVYKKASPNKRLVRSRRKPASR